MTVEAMQAAYRSHVGKVRQHNEDYLIAIPDRGVFSLGDGMGGHCAGEVASKLAVETAARALLLGQQSDLGDELEGLLYVNQAVEQANSAVCDAVVKSPELRGMGTTLVITLFRSGRVYFAHVGDSRLYCLHKNRLRQFTRDHSLIQEALDTGVFASRQEAFEAGVGDNILTRSIGLDRHVMIDVGDAELHEDDIFLLCSDGLCGKVPDVAIQDTLNQGDDLDQMADALLQLALDCGGRDNISLILARKARPAAQLYPWEVADQL